MIQEAQHKHIDRLKSGCTQYWKKSSGTSVT
jgi:hypothetical protein